MRWKHLAIGILSVILLAAGLIYLAAAPSNSKDWRTDQRVLGFAQLDGDLVHVYNIRNFTYRSLDDYDVSYYDATYNLSELRTVHYLIEPFARWKGISHTFMTFDFSDGRHLVVSVEARKERREKFSALNGVLRQYELIYVISDEQDAIKRRTNFEGNEIMMYRLNLTVDREQHLLAGMLERANALRERPEFYNTFTNSCTTNLIDHLNTVAPKKIPWSYKVMFPGYSDIALRDASLIDTRLPLDEARERYRIRQVALLHGNNPRFSSAIHSVADQDIDSAWTS